MKLNFRRGFFRIWIAVAVLWIVPALIINSKDLGLTAQPKSDATVTVNDPKDQLFEARGPDGKTYQIEAYDEDSAGIAIDEFFELLGRVQVPPTSDAGGVYVWPTKGTRIWVERPTQKTRLKRFKITEPDGTTVHIVEANSPVEAHAGVIEMKASGGYGALQSEQASGGSEPIFVSPFVSPTNGARVWAARGLFDNLPTAEEERAARHLPTPSEQEAALTSARNEALAIVFIPPLALLGLGVFLGWIVRGFLPKPSPFV